MVAVGSIGALRTLEKPRWRIEGPPGSLGWPRQLAGVEVVSTDGDTTVLEVQRARTDVEQEILRAALGAGPVRYFGEVHPHLIDLYRHAVSEPAQGEDSEPAQAAEPPGQDHTAVGVETAGEVVR